jgi:hypothetical protein
MKRVSHFNTSRDKLLHIETEGGIVNIRVGLVTTGGNSFTHIEILPDNSKGEEWTLDGSVNNCLIKQ